MRAATAMSSFLTGGRGDRRHLLSATVRTMGCHSLIPYTWMSLHCFESGPALSTLLVFSLGYKAGATSGGQGDEFRNMGSEGRLVCQPPKHFPDKEEISKNR